MPHVPKPNGTQPLISMKGTSLWAAMVYNFTQTLFTDRGNPTKMRPLLGIRILARAQMRTVSRTSKCCLNKDSAAGKQDVYQVDGLLRLHEGSSRYPLFLQELFQEDGAVNEQRRACERIVYGFCRDYGVEPVCTPTSRLRIP